MTPNQDKRAVLEAVAYGPDVAPGDRLRALEQLERLDEGGERREFLAEIERMDESELAMLEDLHVADVIKAITSGDERLGLDPKHYPETTKLLRVWNRRRDEHEARVEAEIERRAQKRARELVHAELALRTPKDLPERVDAGAQAPVRPPAGIEPGRGWRRQGGTVLRRIIDGDAR